MIAIPTRRSLLAAAFSTPLLSCARATPPRDTLRMAVTALPPSLGDPFQADGTPSIHVWAALFDGLTRLDASGEIAPALAASWRALDPTTWRFDLRTDVRFANGAPFDANAAKATFDFLGSKQGRASVIGARVRDIVAVEAPDPATLILRTKTPDAALPRRMPSVLIVEPKAWAAGVASFSAQPIGTGPYRLLRWNERTRSAELAATDAGLRRATAARLDIVELAEESVRVQALISREVDIARVGVDDREYLRARGLGLVVAPSFQVMAIALRTARKDSSPLKDVRVRRALNHAIDRETLASGLLAGLGAPIGQPAGARTFGHDPTIAPYAYDPERARALLAAAGHGAGFPLIIEVVTNSLPADSLIYQAVAQDLRRIGVDVRMRAIPFPTFLRKYLSNDWGEVDAFGLSFAAAPFNDAQRPMENYSCVNPKPFHCDEATGKLLRAAKAEFDPARRLAKLRALSQRFHDEAPAIYLFEQFDLYGVSPRLTGVQLANRTPEYEAIRIKP
jgi:peptide/nickel transport system substrate-binding protein